MSKSVPVFFNVKAPEAHKPSAPKLRATITPGTVLILLSGRYAGKRVVFLKQLASGLLLVSGPYKINKVPLCRVTQSHVIATSTKLDIGSVKIPTSVDDSFFNGKKSTEEKKATQEAVDVEVVKSIEGVPMMKEYLSSRFRLSKRSRPHEMKF